MADDDLLIKIDLTNNLDAVLKDLDDFHADQLPFAIASALFAVGLDAREEMIRQLPSKFTIRTGKKPWAARPLYVWPDKTSRIKKNILEDKGAFVTVATRDDLGRMLTDGGEKTHKQGKDLGVPIVGGGRKNIRSIIRPGRTSPSDIVKKRKGFLLPLKSGGQLLVVRKRKSRKGQDDRQAIQAMFYMKTKVRIKPWWDLRDLLGRAMTAWLPKRFEKACAKAMETRR